MHTLLERVIGEISIIRRTVLKHYVDGSHVAVSQQSFPESMSVRIVDVFSLGYVCGFVSQFYIAASSAVIVRFIALV